MSFEPDQISTVLCDLDGVVWLAHQPIPGSVEAIARLRASGRRVMFVTNNSSKLVAEQESALGAIGIPAIGDVVSSAMAGAALVAPGERVLVAGGPGVVEAVERRGATALLNDGETDHGPVDAVVVGLHREFDYWRLATAAKAVMNGARLIGTNGDTTFPTPSGLEPGGGALVAAVATVAGVDAVIGGKPHRPMADVILDVLSTAADRFDPQHALMVGDRLDTDGLFGRELGSPFALVRSGVIEPGAAIDPSVPVALDVSDLAAVAAALG
ncbi:HAD-IIA family hydrolase [Ilumatobacter coccineus]|uniref:Putative phosphatase n=1 Tax=Ilumatobacter coccineus (strain NBRC 103263 / KCTC 29153 / YM16-304) TaxID=1313172 RepID=A0A6C7EC86_ILUCY|nr:HAD-IIA family hydrolase [Ilumatobacter coccineus]BAN02799.1 putative phosphatase [Ilumatobacter coccineus YM16-304]